MNKNVTMNEASGSGHIQTTHYTSEGEDDNLYLEFSHFTHATYHTTFQIYFGHHFACISASSSNMNYILNGI